jgi:hypothetical protein
MNGAIPRDMKNHVMNFFMEEKMGNADIVGIIYSGTDFSKAVEMRFSRTYEIHSKIEVQHSVHSCH